MALGTVMRAIVLQSPGASIPVSICICICILDQDIDIYCGARAYQLVVIVSLRRIKLVPGRQQRLHISHSHIASY